MDVTITPKIARWLGLLITDGHLNKTCWHLKFTNKETILLEDFQALTKYIFGLNGKLIKAKNRTPEIQINSTKLVKFVNMNFGIPIGNKSGKIKVPSQILLSENLEVIRYFLQGVFDGDGSVVENKKYYIKRVDLASKSIEFLKGVHVLLKKLQIDSRIDEKQNRLLITRIIDIKKFADFVDFLHPKRHLKLRKLL